MEGGSSEELERQEVLEGTRINSRSLESTPDIIAALEESPELPMSKDETAAVEDPPQLEPSTMVAPTKNTVSNSGITSLGAPSTTCSNE